MKCDTGIGRQWLANLMSLKGFDTIEDLASATGLKARTIRAWVDGETTPHSMNRAILIMALGDEAADELNREDKAAAARLRAEKRSQAVA